MRSSVKSLAASLFCLAAACGGDPAPMDMAPPDMAPPAYFCDQTGGTSPSCKEFTNISATQTMDGLQALCPATLAMGLCPRANLLGGCRASNANYTLTTWFYPGTMFSMSSQVMTYCASAYVPPN